MRKLKRPRLTRHHRKMKCRGGTNDTRNLHICKAPQHRAFHLLFQNMTAVQIAKELTDKWIDPDWKLVAVKR